MHRKAPKLLEDVRDAAEFIGKVTGELNLDDYKANRLLRQGVERNLEVIGKAVKRLAAIDSATAEQLGDYRRVIAFRNALVHGYDLPDYELVWQTIRTQVVSLRRSAEALLHRFHRLPRGLYVLTPETDDDEWLVAAVTAAIRGGASAVQYRNKTLKAAEQLRQGRALREACCRLNVTFLVNDSPELARDLEADGVHLGRDDAFFATARTLLGAKAIIGVSCYDSLERALETRNAADYCAFGSVFPSTVKPDAVRAPLGLFERARDAGLHTVAIGGISAGNAGHVAAAGAESVAVITSVFGESGSLCDEKTIEASARRVSEAFEAGITRSTSAT